MTIHPSLSMHSGTPLANPTEYRSLVGSLQYLSLTRLDISFVVNKLSQYMQKPTEDHWVAIKRLLRYLAGPLHKGYYFVETHLIPFMPSRTLIGQELQIIIYLQQVILSTWATILYPGVLANNVLLLALQLKPNIGLLHLQPQKFYGSKTYLLN